MFEGHRWGHQHWGRESSICEQNEQCGGGSVYARPPRVSLLFPIHSEQVEGFLVFQQKMVKLQTVFSQDFNKLNFKPFPSPAMRTVLYHVAQSLS